MVLLSARAVLLPEYYVSMAARLRLRRRLTASSTGATSGTGPTMLLEIAVRDPEAPSGGAYNLWRRWKDLLYLEGMLCGKEASSPRQQRLPVLSSRLRLGPSGRT